MQNFQIALRVNEDDGFIASFNGLQNVELEIVRLASSSRSGYEHVPFQITEAETSRLFSLSTDRVKHSHRAEIHRATCTREALPRLSTCQPLIGDSGIPQ